MKLFSANHELRALLALAVPMLATQLAQIGMGTVDTIMAGYVSTVDLAAVAIGTAIWLPTWLFLAGILVALTPMAARLRVRLHDNHKDSDGQYQDLTNHSDQTNDKLIAEPPTKLHDLYAAAVKLSIGASLLTAFVLAAIASQLSLFIEDNGITKVATNYLYAIAISMPAAGMFLAARFYAEAMNRASSVTRIMLFGLLLNIPFNAIFVYGLFGFPELGGVGCGVGSALVMLFLAVAMTRNVIVTSMPPRWSLLHNVLNNQWNDVKDILFLGLPIGAAIFFEVSLFTVIALLITPLGATIVAGHQIALNVSSLTFMLPLSLGMALTVRVSSHIGRENVLAAKKTSQLGIIFNLILATFNATLLLVGAEWLSDLYSPDENVVAVASSLLIFAAFFQFSDAIQIAAAGALRGYHDTAAIMKITFITYWCLGLGSGYWLAYGHLKLGAAGFWSGLIIGLTAAAIALGLRLHIKSTDGVKTSM